MFLELQDAIDAAEAALDAVVDSNDWWKDVPFAFDDNALESMESWPKPLRIECSCGFCGAKFCPIATVEEYDGQFYNVFHWCYYQAGYWFGDTGNGRHFPVCSDGCHDALRRLLEKRRIHTSQEMQQVAKARRLVRECRAVAKRLRNAKGLEGRAAVMPGRGQGHPVVGQPDRVPELAAR